jgi:AraC-like DNA-binding protein
MLYKTRDMGPLEQTRMHPQRLHGLISSVVSGRRIHSETCAPSANLTDLIEWHWSSSWDLQEQEPHTVRMLSDPCVHLVFEHRASRLVGVSTKCWSRTLTGTGRMFAVKIRAGMAATLLHQRLRAFANSTMPLTVPAAEEQAILACPDIGAARLLMERFVENMPMHNHQEAVWCRDAIELIRSAPHLTTVGQLADELGTSLRTLQQRFSRHVGASPKWVLRLFRLQEAAMILKREDTPLTDLALSLGYADQAHFCRDFKAIIGMTPSAFRLQQ